MNSGSNPIATLVWAFGLMSMFAVGGANSAGIAGALAATVAMCGPTAVLAYYVSRLLARSSGSRWPAIVQAALVPLLIGLMGASGLILALTADRSWVAGLITATAAALAFATRLNPLWMLLAGGHWVLLALSEETR